MLNILLEQGGMHVRCINILSNGALKDAIPGARVIYSKLKGNLFS